ncbi:MAG: peptidylprolyl isomerase [Methylococcaceae bacterium]|jgi:peptidyl-prolyl cis-trans isomerase C|nr:peptidylprolyl isomerase [Methylococcaceae bacterium]MDZ4157776.1 peptidylprolyl isomerase [Methylococcales bacterium]MDP2392120.1 peptidylprolyl isomerase [Methylococcaceae bacterium]MDP3020828.1 peptidylprolyl isomerase [Methylococcaceae bacterium]MDP3391646.1 peptidylprolyl isomerase [Methylococcaceae bacterium]
MKKQFIPLLIVGSALIAGCNQQPSTDTSSVSAPAVDKADAVASVNGKYIAKSTLEQLETEISQRSQGQTFPKEKLIEELIQRELLVQEGLKKQLDKSPEVLARIEDVKRSLVSQAALQDYLKTNPVTDADIKAEYDTKVAAENGTEFKARHILVKTEAEAKKIITELDKGADFAKLANKNSLDAKESQNGGDLGWFVASQMVAPFSEAVAKLEKGKYTKEPVQTQFGWHIILREDSRALTPPPLEAVKEQLQPYLQRQKVQTFIDGLRKQAQVEVLVPLTEEKPKAAENAQPAEAGQPVAEEVIVEEVKDAKGKTVEEKVIVEEVIAPAPENKAEATDKKPAEAKK